MKNINMKYVLADNFDPCDPQGKYISLDYIGFLERLNNSFPCTPETRLVCIAKTETKTGTQPWYFIANRPSQAIPYSAGRKAQISLYLDTLGDLWITVKERTSTVAVLVRRYPRAGKGLEKLLQRIAAPNLTAEEMRYITRTVTTPMTGLLRKDARKMYTFAKSLEKLLNSSAA